MPVITLNRFKKKIGKRQGIQSFLRLLRDEGNIYAAPMGYTYFSQR